MQNKSKLSKQKNLRATVSESLPGKSPDLRLQTDRHTCGPDRARGHPGGLGLGDRTKTRHPRESDRPRFLRQPLQAGRGKQKNRLQRPSRHECRAQDPTKRTKRLRFCIAFYWTSFNDGKQAPTRKQSTKNKRLWKKSNRPHSKKRTRPR